jgi:hypothetical protein
MNWRVSPRSPGSGRTATPECARNESIAFRIAVRISAKRGPNTPGFVRYVSNGISRPSTATARTDVRLSGVEIGASAPWIVL